MNPIGEFTVLRFLAWLAPRQPRMRRLRDMTESERMHLADEFERGVLRDSPRLEAKWRSTFRLLLDPDHDFGGYARARDELSRIERDLDPLERYGTVPLHAVFLYSSQDREIEPYLRKHWRALDGMSGDACDIYSSLSQLQGSREDAYRLLDRADEVPGLSSVQIDELPGLYFWDNNMRGSYLRLGPGSEAMITERLRSVFAEIRRAPTVETVDRFVERERVLDERPRRELTSASKLSVVFFAANPLVTGRLALDEEMREIERKLRMSPHGEDVLIHQAWATRAEDLIRYMNQYRPHIVHFSGHGSSAGEIMLVGGNGQSQPVGPQALKALFATMADNVRLVLLNACYSKQQGAAIAEVVDYVIGMNTSVTDSAATTFASTFYAALGFHRTIREAYEQAKVALMLEDWNAGEHQTPELLVREGMSVETSLQ